MKTGQGFRQLALLCASLVLLGTTPAAVWAASKGPAMVDAATNKLPPDLIPAPQGDVTGTLTNNALSTAVRTRVDMRGNTTTPGFMKLSTETPSPVSTATQGSTGTSTDPSPALHTHPHGEHTNPADHAAVSGSANGFATPDILNKANGAVQATDTNWVKNTDTRLSDSRPPMGGAGGDLAGTYPNPQIGIGLNTHTDLDVSVDASGLMSPSDKQLLNNLRRLYVWDRHPSPTNPMEYSTRYRAGGGLDYRSVTVTASVSGGSGVAAIVETTPGGVLTPMYIPVGTQWKVHLYANIDDSDAQTMLICRIYKDTGGVLTGVGVGWIDDININTPWAYDITVDTTAATWFAEGDRIRMQYEVLTTSTHNITVTTYSAYSSQPTWLDLPTSRSRDYEVPVYDVADTIPVNAAGWTVTGAALGTSMRTVQEALDALATQVSTGTGTGTGTGTATSSLTVTTAQVATDTYVGAWYKFDEAPLTSTGTNTNTQTMVSFVNSMNTSTSYSASIDADYIRPGFPGVHGNSAFITNTGRIKTAAGLYEYTSALTISFWMRANTSVGSANTNFNMITKMPIPGSNYSPPVIVGLQNNQPTTGYRGLVFQICTASCDAGTPTVYRVVGLQYVSLPANDFPLYEWLHIAATFDGRYLRIYMNGVQLNVYDVGSTTSISYARHGEWDFGNIAGDNTRTGDWRIDDLRIESTARSAAYVLDMYQRGANKFPNVIQR